MASSSVVVQGMQQCPEPGRFVAMAPWGFSGLQKSPSPSDPHPEEQEAFATDDGEAETQNAENGGWSFLQSIISKTDTNAVYVHPLANSAKLSKRSLEMCTEGLGSETGHCPMGSSEEMSLFTPKTHPKKEALRRTGERALTGKGSNRVEARFPPAIRSSGDGVRVKPRREGGRLVLEAVSVSSSISGFHVERNEGRLRLCLLRDSEEGYDKSYGA
ncbi:PREDICTED: protein FANTASTIC FOUR 2-like [Tarenaya hassleriana]|uniref:protein FANTASTIC FOUR 2-like n=1 Tax=Tarenaya hassleriana TaxID=28532 RepID=UPI00053C61B3|nr:PREDICTED: protein FANTASTIC FOUR 2-like [Tarenaya hassleriana]